MDGVDTAVDPGRKSTAVFFFKRFCEHKYYRKVVFRLNFSVMESSVDGPTWEVFPRKAALRRGVLRAWPAHPSPYLTSRSKIGRFFPSIPELRAFCTSPQREDIDGEYLHCSPANS